MGTLLYANRPPHQTASKPDGADWWLDAAEVTRATGWELKPEGLCQDDRCVRIPHDRERELVAPGTVNVGALARLLEQVVVRDDAHAVWSVAESSPARRAAMESLQAPDFTLPDLDGRLHRLSDYRGRKVFLVSWASW